MMVKQCLLAIYPQAGSGTQPKCCKKNVDIPKLFLTSLTLTDNSQEMILGSATIQTMPKQDGMLAVTCFVKLVFQLSLFIHRQTHNPSVWTIRWWKSTDCQSGIRGGDKLVIRTPVSNPS
jgi:hypothetical protein